MRMIGVDGVTGKKTTWLWNGRAWIIYNKEDRILNILKDVDAIPDPPSIHRPIHSRGKGV